MFFPILTTTFTQETSGNKFKNSRQPDFQAQANSIITTHSPSQHILEETEDLESLGGLGFVLVILSACLCLFKLLTYDHLFEGSSLVSQPRYFRLLGAWTQMDISDLCQIPFPFRPLR